MYFSILYELNHCIYIYTYICILSVFAREDVKIKCLYMDGKILIHECAQTIRRLQSSCALW